MENKRQIFQKTGFSIQCQCKQFILVHRFPFHFFFAHFAEASMLLTDYRLQRDDDHQRVPPAIFIRQRAAGEAANGGSSQETHFNDIKQRRVFADHIPFRLNCRVANFRFKDKSCAFLQFNRVAPVRCESIVEPLRTIFYNRTGSLWL